MACGVVDSAQGSKRLWGVTLIRTMTCMHTFIAQHPSLDIGKD
jgi:hypothetical protein